MHRTYGRQWPAPALSAVGSLSEGGGEGLVKYDREGAVARCRKNMAHIIHSSADPGFGFQVKVPNTFHVVLPC